MRWGSITNFFRGAAVEVMVPTRSFVQADHGSVHRFGDLRPVMQDGLHELTMVSRHRALASMEGVGLGPSQADANAEIPGLSSVVNAARIIRDVQAGYAQRAAGARDLHERVQHCRGPFHNCVCPVSPASNPTQSTAQSTSGTPRMDSICSARVADWLRSTVSHPKLRACARRSGIMSPTITTAAPNSRHASAQANPTGPAPAT